MLPTARIFGLTIQTPLLAIIVALTVAMSVAARHAARRGLDANVVSNAAFYGLIAGALGARLGYVLSNFEAYAREPLSALALNTTALLPWSGWLAGIAIALFYLWRKRQLKASLIDALAPGVAIFAMGLALADLLNGDTFGLPASLPWSVYLWNEWRHPVQLYEFVALAGIWLILELVSRRKLPTGAMALLFIGAYAFARVIVDGFRAEGTLLAGMRMTQLAGVLISAVAVWMLAELLREAPVQTSPSQEEL
jgi:phosphatidylglycerol:prolipoprotein diacylglycerol transferase